jgi:hypothetical protein
MRVRSLVSVIIEEDDNQTSRSLLSAGVSFYLHLPILARDLNFPSQQTST